MTCTTIFDIRSPIERMSMKRYIRPVSTAPENILPPKNSDISLRMFGLLLSNTQILLVMYAKRTEKNQAMTFEIR